MHDEPRPVPEMIPLADDASAPAARSADAALVDDTETGSVADPDAGMTAAADAPPAARAPFDWRGLFGTLLTVLPIPLLLLGFLLATRSTSRIMLGATALALGGVGLVRWTKADARGRRDLMSAMFIAGGFALAAALIWNEAYLNFIKTITDHKEVFRANMWRWFAPFYGRIRFSEWTASLPVVALVIGLWWATWKWHVDRPMRWWGLAVIVLLQAALIAALGFTDWGHADGIDRIRGTSRGFQNFRDDAAIFSSVRDLFKSYVGLMPDMSWLNQHYPPGTQLLFFLERKFDLKPLGGWVTTIVVCLSTPFVYFAACALTPRPLARNAATVVYATATGGLLYPLISSTPLILLPGAIAAWAFLRGLRGPVAAVVCGVILGAAVMAFGLLSFSVVFFLSVIGAAWLACARWRLARVTPLVLLPVVSIGIFLLIYFWLRKTANFDLLACAIKGHALHRKQMNSNGFDTFGEWFMRSTANGLAFTLANLPLLGLAVASALAWRPGDRFRLERLLLPISALAIIAAAFSGAFYLETERIWVLYLPLLAVGGGCELARHDDTRDVRRMIVLATLFVVAQELVFIHGVL